MTDYERMQAIDNILYGEHEQPYSTGDSLLLLFHTWLREEIDENNKGYEDIIKWLFGEAGDFPESKPGQRYNWRIELRERFKALREKENGTN